MSLSLKKKDAAVTKGKGMKIPSKRTMNFVHHESSFNPRRMVPVILLMVILAGVLVKFGILDMNAQKIRALDDLARKQEQLSGLNQALSGYEKVSYDYGRYSYGWMDEKEINLLNRMDVLKMIEEMVATDCNIENLAITDNVMTMNIHGLTLHEVSDMVMKLETSEIVKSASVYNAVADEAVEAKVSLSITMEKPAEEEK